MAASFDINVFKQKLQDSAVFGKKIVYMDTTESTMDDAYKCGVSDYLSYPHGTIFLAERQTKARGARNHRWDASNTGNIYLSIILHLPEFYKTFEGKFELEVAACMAVWQVVNRLGVKAIPKWPNDLWVRGHKLAGFLAEDGKFFIPGSDMCLVILGMGINVNADVRQSLDLNSFATSLLCERNGDPVFREEFLSDVCKAFEESLKSRTDNLAKFRSHNVFQKGCVISVTCAPENKVIDGQFEEVKDNWELSFVDKLTNERLQGRSNYYSIRPKVERKILVVFSGSDADRPAAVLASKLTVIVDTSKHVVCSVPESTITQSDEWMKTCDLLVLAESIFDPTRMTSKLKSYLRMGGHLLSSGCASSFVGETFDYQFKTETLEPKTDGGVISTVSIDANNGGEVEGGREKSLSVSQVIFPSPLSYLKFSESSCNRNQTVESTDSGKSAEQSGKSHLSYKYLPYNGQGDYCVAVMTCPTTHGGGLALFGFDLGATIPIEALSDVDEGNGDGTSSDELLGKDLHNDRFKRDMLISQVLHILNIT